MAAVATAGVPFGDTWKRPFQGPMLTSERPSSEVFRCFSPRFLCGTTFVGRKNAMLFVEKLWPDTWSHWSGDFTFPDSVAMRTAMVRHLKLVPPGRHARNAIGVLLVERCKAGSSCHLHGVSYLFVGPISSNFGHFLKIDRMTVSLVLFRPFKVDGCIQHGFP